MKWRALATATNTAAAVLTVIATLGVAGSVIVATLFGLAYLAIA